MHETDATGRQLEVRVLGELAVVRGGVEAALGGRRQRAVLALLVANSGHVVPTERLVEDLWQQVAPTTRTGPLRTYVHQLRRLLGDGGERSPLLSRAPGYLLDLEPDQIDARRFEQRFAEARGAAASGRPDDALDRLDAGLRLWRGRAYGDLADEPAIRGEATRLDQLRLGAEEMRAELMLVTGQHLHAAADIGALARANPLREHLWALLMLAHYRAGRQAEALRCYGEAQRHLAEVGLGPGQELRDLEQAILHQDPALQWRPRSVAGLAGSGGNGRRPRPVDRGRPPHNLPRQVTSFVGRAAERREVADALTGARLVTLTGSGGCGKTRLALTVAADVLGRFPDGVWFADLAAVTDPALVARAVAAPLGAESDQPDQLDLVCRRIGEERLLVVLDNCEHVVEAAAELADLLLVRCPAVRILATSREELRLGAERVWRVPALSLPEPAGPGDPPGDRTDALASEAVQLFVERGRSALARFDPTGDALEAVAQICCRLDGIPLAIELAAALVGSLPVAEIAARLDDRFRLLGRGPRRAVPRHRTLAATLDWSHELLDPPTRRLFAELGVFVGDFTLAAAERVAGGPDDPLGVALGLRRLVETSMVACVSGRDGADRYRMLETVRQYAGERLALLADGEEIRARHAAYYAELAAEAESHVHGTAASDWLARVVQELPNLRAAMTWAFSHGDLETGLRLAGSLRWFFARLALLDEGARWLEAGLARGDELPVELRLQALTAAGTLAYMRGDLTWSRERGEEAIALARHLGDDHQLAVALIVRGGTVVYEGDLHRAEECFEEAQDLCLRLGDRWGRAWLLTGWATGSRRAGKLDRARDQFREALALFRALGDVHGQVLPLVNLAIAAQEEGDTTDAHALADEAVRLAVGLEDRQLQHVSLCVLGGVEAARGHLRRARDLLLRSIRRFPGAHNQYMVAVALEALAEMAAAGDRHAEATALMGFTQAMRQRKQLALSESRARAREACLDRARAALGPEGLAAELDRGRALELDEAVSLAETATRS